MILKTHYPHIYMNDDKKPSFEINVGKDVGYINANFGEHLSTTNNDVEFTTTDFEREPIPQYIHDGISQSTPYDE